MFGRPQPFLFAFIRAKNHRVSGRIRFLVDTGTSETIINVTDALRLNIPYKSLNTSKSICGLGGMTMQGFSMNNVEIFFKDDQGAQVSEKLPKVMVSKWAKKDQKSKKNALSAPSLLGADMLAKYDLFLSLSNDEAYLEKAQKK